MITCGNCNKMSEASLWFISFSDNLQCPNCKIVIKLTSAPGETRKINGKYMYIPGKTTIEQV